MRFNQQEVKHQRDSAINHTDLVLQPPLIRPEREIGLPLSLRPRGEIGERRFNGTRHMPIPQVGQAGKPLEEAARLDALHYFGKDKDRDPVRVAMYNQSLASDFCDEEAEIWRHILKLCQQFEDNVEFQRKVGGKPSTIRLSREEIQGEYDLMLTYNTDELDPDMMKSKIELLHKFILPANNGEIDPAPISRGLLYGMFPEYADEAVRDSELAAKKEVDEEEMVFAKMVGNVEAEMKEDGQNHGLRLQWLDQHLSKPATQQLIQGVPHLEELVSKRREHLEFMVQQKQVNAQTGRVGVQAGG